MAFETIVVINFRHESAIRTLSHFTTLDSVLDFIMTKWPCCDKDNLRFSYNFGDVINCRIDNEEDYRLLQLLVGQSGPGVRLHMFAKEGSDSGQVVINPSSIDKVVINPSSIDKVVIDPSSIDNVVIDPSSIDKVVTDPSSIDKVVNDLSSIDKVVTDPSSIDKVVNDPSSIDKVVTDPSSIDKVDKVVNDPSSIDKVSSAKQQIDITLSCPPRPIARENLLSSDWGKGLERVGQMFEGGAVEFRDILRKYALDRGFSFQYLHNTSKKITANCIYKKSRGCPWRAYAKTDDINGFMYLRSFVDEHTCGALFQTDNTNQFNSAMVSRLICDEVRSNPHMTAVDVIKTVNSKYGYDIPYHIAFNGLGKAKKECFGDPFSSYNEIRHLFCCIQSEDPDSRVDMEVHPETHAFERCFVAFGAWLHGFKFCRPILFLNAICLTGKYKGILLAATAKDGDQGLFPIAFAIVKSEDTDNWTWFLNTLKPLILNHELTFISDRLQGIINSVKIVFPNSSHSYCLLHLQNNLRDKLSRNCVKCWRDKMVYLLQNCAYAPTVAIYQKWYNDLIKEGDRRVLDFMESLPKEHYANAYFRGRRYGEITNNAAESLSAMIKAFQDLPVVELINSIRVKWMEKFSECRDVSSTWTTPLCPSFELKINDLLKEGNSWKVDCLSSAAYEVCCSPTMAVDIEKRTCSCCMWQVEGFPCAHALCVLKFIGKNYVEYIEQYFHTSHFWSTYAKHIPALSSFGQARVVDDVAFVNPPIAKRQPGRPRKKRNISSEKS